jgi:hypothetical protein
MPAAAAGTVTVICVLLFTVKDGAGVCPKLTAVAAVNPLPVTTTEPPPAIAPLDAVSPVTTGTAASTDVN